MSKVKYQIGDWVRCTEHGTEFQISVTGIIYGINGYGREYPYPCNRNHVYDLHSSSFLVPEHLLEPVTDFRIGDTVEQIAGFFDSDDKIATVTRIGTGFSGKQIWHVHKKNTEEMHAKPNSFKLIKRGSEMSRYEELKRKIHEVEGWTKDVDDMLEEITTSGGGHFTITIPSYGEIGEFGNIIVNTKHWNCCTSGKQYMKFSFTSQCSKNTAFKSALMWLLDHSSLKDDKKEKREQLQTQLNDIQKQLDELK